MNKKILGGVVAVAIAAIAAVNVNFNSEAEDALSGLSLANVEALAQGESVGKALSVITRDLGTSSECINGYSFSIQSYRIDCLGTGNLDCEEGEFAEITLLGKCYFT